MSSRIPIDPKQFDSPEIPSARQIFRSLPFALRYVRDASPRSFWILMCGSVLFGPILALSALATKNIGDAIFAGDATVAIWWGGALVGTAVLNSVVRFFKMREGEILRFRLQLKNDEAQMAHLAAIPLEITESSWFQRLASQFREKAWRVTNIAWELPAIVDDIASALGAATVFLFAPWQAGAWVIGAAILRIYLARREAEWEWDVIDMEKREGRRARYYERVLTNPLFHTTTKSLQLEEPFLERWRRLTERVMEKRLDGVRQFSRSLFWSDALEAIGLACGLWITLMASLDGRATPGAVLAFLVGYQRVWGSIANIMDRFRMFLKDGVLLPVMEAFFRVPHQSTDGDAVPREYLEVVFEDVWFAYPGSDQWVLKGVTCRFSEGDHLALIGLNGAGKSTLLKLLLGVYAPTKGRILVNGKNLEQIQSAAWRASLAVMHQDVVRFHDEIFQQVQYGDLSQELQPAVLERAMSVSGMDHITDEFPRGIGTFAGKEYAMPEDEAIELSGGQNQLLSVARTLYRPARFYIFDEPTSAVDAEKEEAFFSALPEALAGKGVIFVSHRFSTLRRASRILVLDGGRIIEDGSHEELLDLGGRYAELFALQAKMYK